MPTKNDYTGGFAQCRENIEEMIGFAELETEKGPVYQMRWPSVYARDVRFLLNVIDELKEAINECKTSKSSAKRVEVPVRAGLDKLTDEVLSGEAEEIRTTTERAGETSAGCNCGSGFRCGG